MVKVFAFILLSLVLVGTMVSAYYCIDETDNQQAVEFKNKINTLAIKYDIERGTSEEAIKTKIKLFHPCKEW